MKRFFLMSLLAMIMLTAKAAAVADYGQVVPQPQTISLDQGAKPFALTSETVIDYTPGREDMARNARFLAQYVRDMTKLQLATAPMKGKAKGRIHLILDPKAKNLSGDGYAIAVDQKMVVVMGRTPAAVFYGIQTLRKSLPILQAAESVELPAVAIADKPRFAYRGMMLDCARHFFPAKFVKEYIDLLALHNMNRFHWHLTDDQGWRLVVPGYPRLTEVGAWRSGTVLGHNSEVTDSVRYGGYYTDAEIRDIVKYAADRYITIIPEIDMPGHMMSALASYPELGCTGGPYATGQYWGVYRDILCAGTPQVYAFVKAVLDKVCDLFPGEYVHIGGDESPRVRWENCPKCQKLIAEQHIEAKDGKSKEALLQGYFSNRVQKYLEAKGRKIIGWDELLECDVDTSATIMSWRGAEPGGKGAELGHEVIMSPNSPLYFDHYQSKEQGSEPPAIGGFSDVASVYVLEPVAPQLSAKAKARIVGVQANVWTEYITVPQQVEYMVLPRMAALSEVQWVQPAAKDFDAFKGRVSCLRRIYELYGYTYAHHLWPEEFRKIAKTY